MGRRLANFVSGMLITAALASGSGLALAAPLSAEQATELLARSQAANSKCGILEAQDASELDRLVSLAERSLLAKQNQSVADRAIAMGQKVGSAVKCDATTSQAVRGVLRAAREATAAMQSAQVQVPAKHPELRGTVSEQQAATSVAEEEPVAARVSEEADEQIERNIDTDISGIEPVQGEDAIAEQKPIAPIKKSAKKAQVVAEKKKSKPIVKVSASAVGSKLQSYGQLAQYYYLQRRCRSMSRASITNLYNKVVASHRATLRSHNASQVAAVMRQAEARASRGGCS